MKKIIPIIIYLTVSIVCLVLARFKINQFVVGLVFLNFLFFFIYLVKSIINAFKCKFKSLSAYVLLFMSPTFIIVWLKLDFEYYHFYYHLIYCIVFAGLILLQYKNEKNYFQTTKIILFALLLNICTLSISDYYIFEFWNSDKISWSEEKNEWENYEKLIPIESSDTNVITTNGLQWKISKTNNTPSVLIIGYMMPSESWVKNSHKTKNQLKHEQLYIDICELHARKIRKIFKENKYGIDENGSYLSLKNMTDSTRYYEIYSVSEAERVIRNIVATKNKMNNSYMLATEKGQNEKKQDKWEVMIKEEMLALEVYKR